MKINFEKIDDIGNALDEFSKMETEFFKLGKSFKDKWESYVKDGWDLTLFFIREGVKKIGILGYTIKDVETNETFRSIGEKYSFLLVIALDKDFRGKSIGKEMMKKFIDDSKAKGVQSMALRVDPKNTNALSLYLKSNFKEYSRNENSVYLQMRFNKDI